MGSIPRLLTRFSLLLFFAACLSGCLFLQPRNHPRHTHVPPGQTGKVVHKHGPRCGHGYQNGRWVVVHPHGPKSQHRHGAGCGHRYVGGRWVLKVVIED
jgi:hypothetical protein